MTREEFQKQLPELVKDYQPAADVVEHIGRLRVLMIIGPSGVGKSTLINKLGLHYVPSDNTRPPRPGEREGIDFYFRNDFENVVSEIKNGRFVQVAVDSGGDLKATKATSYPKQGDVVMAIVADVVPLFRTMGFADTLTTFIAPPSYKEWMRRLGDHELDSEQLAKRLSEAKRSLEFGLNDPETHFVLSDNVNSALDQINGILVNKFDQKREDAARSAAEEIFHKLKNQ